MLFSRQDTLVKRFMNKQLDINNLLKCIRTAVLACLAFTQGGAVEHNDMLRFYTLCMLTFNCDLFYIPKDT